MSAHMSHVHAHISPALGRDPADVGPLLVVGTAVRGLVQDLAKVQGFVVASHQLQGKLLSRSLQASHTTLCTDNRLFARH